jgi:opacity protein-like surface antigen
VIRRTKKSWPHRRLLVAIGPASMLVCTREANLVTARTSILTTSFSTSLTHLDIASQGLSAECKSVTTGSGIEPGAPGGDTRGKSSSDFYTTFRGRIGIALNCWLIYATGGGIGVNYETRVIDDCNTGNCGPDLIDAHTKGFNWGYTVGGGIEHAIGRHWSVKAEYLYFALDDQSFSGQNFFRNGPYGFTAETAGHIVRAGLNFRF